MSWLSAVGNEMLEVASLSKRMEIKFFCAHKKIINDAESKYQIEEAEC